MSCCRGRRPLSSTRRISCPSWPRSFSAKASACARGRNSAATAWPRRAAWRRAVGPAGTGRPVAAGVAGAALGDGGAAATGTQWRALAMPQVRDGFDTVMAGLVTLEQALQPLREAAAGLDACHARAREAVSRLQRWLGDDEPTLDFDTDPAETPVPPMCSGMSSPRGFRCQRTPMDVRLRASRAQPRGMDLHLGHADRGRWLDHIATRLGLDDPHTLVQPSPFNWPEQALCYLPEGLPDPAARGFGTALIQTLRPVLQAAGQGVPVVRLAPCIARGRRGTARRAVAVVRAGRAPRARRCCSVSANRAMACCWARPVSARAWTWSAKR